MRKPAVDLVFELAGQPVAPVDSEGNLVRKAKFIQG